MLIKFWVDRMGNLYGDPKSDRQRRQLVKRIAHRDDNGDALFFHQEADLESVLYDLTGRQVSQAAIRDLREGWDVCLRIHDDHVDAMVGAE
jgi:hypothetical protein